MRIYALEFVTWLSESIYGVKGEGGHRGQEIERGGGRKASCWGTKRDDCGLALRFWPPRVSGAGERPARQEWFIGTMRSYIGKGRAIENTGHPVAGSSVDGIYVQHNKNKI
jgi:hypothetical protein